MWSLFPILYHQLMTFIFINISIGYSPSSNSTAALGVDRPTPSAYFRNFIWIAVIIFLHYNIPKLQLHIYIMSFTVVSMIEMHDTRFPLGAMSKLSRPYSLVRMRGHYQIDCAPARTLPNRLTSGQTNNNNSRVLSSEIYIQ